MAEDEPRYKLNRNAERMDVIHVEHPREGCNTDDAEDMGFVDEMTAEAMLLRGDAVACKSCNPGPGL